MSIRRPGWLTSWPASPGIRRTGSMSCCPGIGKNQSSKLLLLDGSYVGRLTHARYPCKGGRYVSRSQAVGLHSSPDYGGGPLTQRRVTDDGPQQDHHSQNA